MPVREGPPQPPPPPRGTTPRPDRDPAEPAPYPAAQARGGEIILRTPARRAIFIGGLIALFVLVLLLRLFA
jgi:hypothetical protein